MQSLPARLWRFGKAELGALSALLIAALGLLAFIWIADEMAEEGAHGVDQMVLAFLRPTANPHDALGPAWFEHAMAELTTLGGTVNLSIFVTIAVVFLLMQRRIARPCWSWRPSAAGWRSARPSRPCSAATARP